MSTRALIFVHAIFIQFFMFLPHRKAGRWPSASMLLAADAQGGEPSKIVYTVVEISNILCD
jgi:hypothetical protein